MPLCLVSFTSRVAFFDIILTTPSARPQYISPVKHNHFIDFDILRSGYEICPCCNNSYENDLGVDMASAFVAFVEKHYPGRKSYRRNLLEALQLKLSVLSFMSARASRAQ